MSKVFAVIGGGYGDEGKGLMTDYYASQYHDAMVVRSNGGAQAGHTVTVTDEIRHVFSHFGSGSFSETPTYLSKYFVCNPSIFRKEYEEFTKTCLWYKPKIYIDHRSLFTTPYDMLLNQSFEEMRGKDVHGSCGVGFGETLEREALGWVVRDMEWLDVIYHLTAKQFDDYLYEYLDSIRGLYVPERINVDEVGRTFYNILNSDELIQDFIDDCRFMMEHTTIAQPDFLRGNTLIFEGAQGLLLDMDYGYFPHVTRSNCGMKNIADILTEIPGVHDITANYVTRAYSTRHGAGPLNAECDLLDLGHAVVDNTNITNTFQGQLRFAPLDKGLFDSVTDKDFLNYAPRGSKKLTTVTCVDQISDNYSFIQDNEEMHVSKDVFEQIVEQTFDYASYGPTRDNIKHLDK